jgi:hypothetical protein
VNVSNHTNVSESITNLGISQSSELVTSEFVKVKLMTYSTLDP